MMVVCDVCPLPQKFNYATSTCKCPDKKWLDSNQKCQPNPVGCALATDITGTCTEAMYGYYIDGGNSIKKCSVDIVGCDSCKWISGSVSCVVCKGDLQKSSSAPYTCSCDGMTWYNSYWFCQPGIPDCLTKADITGCSACKGQGVLSGSIPEVCNPPSCPGMDYYDAY